MHLLIPFAVGTVLLFLAAIAHRQSDRYFKTLSRPQQQTTDPPLASDEEERFAYAVLSEVFKRSIDRSRFVATLLVALIAAQAGIYVILVDKASEIKSSMPAYMLGIAVVVAIAGTLPSFFLLEIPRAGIFYFSFPRNPAVVRRAVMRQLVQLTEHNEQIGLAQSIMLGLAIGLTLFASVALKLAKGVQ